MHPNHFWSLLFLAGVLIGVGAIGIAHLLCPDWFLKRSGLRRGGELLTEWHRLQSQILGASLAAFAAYGLYKVTGDFLLLLWAR